MASSDQLPNAQSPVAVKKSRSPWIAGLLTLLSPGLGHLYATDIRRGLGFFAVAMVNLLAYWQLPWLPQTPATMAAFYVCVAFAACFLIYAVIDAIRLAKRNNPAILTRFNRWPVYLGTVVTLGLFESIPDFLPDGLGWLQWKSFSIPSSSMIPSLMNSDRVFALERYYVTHEPEAGDVAVFFLPTDGKTPYVKRIVGLPGQRIQMRGGSLFIDGQSAPRNQAEDFVQAEKRYAQFLETLPNGRGYAVLQAHEKAVLNDTQEFIVPENAYFVLGDNRNLSLDSRSFGVVARSLLVGKMSLVFWSSDLNRIGQPVD